MSKNERAREREGGKGEGGSRGRGQAGGRAGPLKGPLGTGVRLFARSEVCLATREEAVTHTNTHTRGIARTTRNDDVSRRLFWSAAMRKEIIGGRRGGAADAQWPAERSRSPPRQTDGRTVRPGGREGGKEGTITKVLCDAAGISD